MSVYLGNLNVDQIEKRIGINFPEDVRDFMSTSHQPSATNIKKGKWHCFYSPFVLVCCDIETAENIFHSIKHCTKDAKEKLIFSIQK